MDNKDSNSCTFITFYSYKGGTGRTMVLVNIACLLANKDNKKISDVLVIDWDLEAPGLHRYCPNMVSSTESKSADGLLDYFYLLEQKFRKSKNIYSKLIKGSSIDEILPINKFIIKNAFPGVDFIKAGRFDTEYAGKAEAFDWVAFFKNYGAAIKSFRELLSKKYRYILIDSRTGFTDTSGICTMIMPEKLVLVFTPNKQSLYGAVDLAKRAIDYRKASNDDFRPLAIFPLPSRIDDAETDLRIQWRDEYQIAFEDLFRTAYELDECDLQSYFDEVQLPYKSFYAYGEKIAVLCERDTANSLHRACKIFGKGLTELDVAWAQSPAYKLSYAHSLLQTGKSYNLQGKIEEAVSFLQLSYNIIQDLNNPKEEVEVLQALGEALQNQGKLEEAMQAFQKNYELSRKFNDEHSVARVLSSLGSVQQQMGKFSEAESTFKKSYVISEKLGDERSVAMALNSLCGVQQRMGKFSEAEQSFQKSYAISEKLGDERSVAMVLNNLGGVQQRMAKFSEAEQSFQKSYEISEKLGDERSVAMALNSLGGVHQRMGKFSEAEQSFQKSYAISEKLGDERSVATVLNSLGGVQQRMGKFSEVEQSLQKSYAISEKLGDERSVAMVLNSLGGVYQRQGKFDEAVQAFLQSYEILDKLSDERGIAMVLNSLGGVYHRQGKLDEAVQTFLQSYVISEKLGDEPSVAMVLNSLGGVYQRQGKFDEAIQVFQKSIEIGEKLEDYRHLAITYTSMGKCQLDSNLNDNAILSLIKGFEINEKMKNKRGIDIVAPLLIQALKNKNDIHQAKEYYKRAVNVSPTQKNLLRLK